MTVVTASTALSPEWDRWFDEEFTDLVTADDDLVRAEFDALIADSWQSPPPAPSTSTAAAPAPGDEGDAASRVGRPPDDPPGDQRSPPE